MSVRICLSAAMLVASVALIPVSGARAAEPELTAEAKTAFDTRMFTAAPVEKGKTYACFVRRYDARHLAAHPDQTVSAMKLLVTAEWLDEDKTFNRNFHMGVKFRNQRGSYDTMGGCSHAMMGEANGEVRLGCGVDCDGGGIGIAMNKDNDATIVRLERVRLWTHGKDLDDDDIEKRGLNAGKDDGMFRLDRVSLDECASLISDRQELAELRTKK